MNRYTILIAVICSSFFMPALLQGQNVGIGTTTPAAKLDIIGSLKITNGTQGANKVLTSDTSGLATWTNPPAPASFFFATDQSVGSNNFLGLGTNSSSFIRSTIVVPVNCELTSIIFSTRGAIGTYTATVYKSSSSGLSPVATTLSTTTTSGNYFSVANGSLPLLQGDLISIQISWQAGGALANGAAVSVSYK